METKGGTSPLGSRLNREGDRVQQGSRGYVQAMVEAMADEKLADRLQAALDKGKVRYILVQQPFDDAGRLAKIQVREFAL